MPRRKEKDTGKSLLLVPSGSSATAGTLELPSFGPDEGLSVTVWPPCSSKVPLCSTGLTGALKEDGVLADRAPHCQLVEGNDLA